MNRNQFDEALKKLDKTPVTKEVLELLLAGYTNAEIAKYRGTSEGTIRKQVSNLYKKFGIEYQSPGDTNSQREELLALFKKYKPEWLSETVIAKPRRKSMDGIDASTSDLNPEEVVRDQSQLSHSLPHPENITPDTSYLVGANSFLEYFSKSVDQLNSKDIHVRIGAISNLGTLAKYSKPAEHWTIMEYLAAFIRTNAPRKEEEQGEEKRAQKIPADIQAALTVIGRRESEKDPENQRLDLSNTDLRGVSLGRTNLQSIDFSRANLQGAILSEANLQGAILKETNLRAANLSKANLKEASISAAILYSATLHRANLHGADLRLAKLQGAYLDEANLEDAKFEGAKFGLNGDSSMGAGTKLQGANLKRANLQGSNFIEASLDDANLQGANFSKANLQGARLYRENLTEAKNLEQYQIDQAFGSKNTTSLPENVTAPDHWM